MRRLFQGFAALVAVAGVVAVGGCGSSSSTTTTIIETQPASTGSSTTSTTPSTTSTAATTSTTSTTDTTEQLSINSFQSPSGNIGCTLSSDPAVARCDIRQRSWTPPPKPANCPLDYGNGLIVSSGTKGAISCAGDTDLNPDDKVLQYGQSTKLGPMSCVSAQAGITCTNTSNSHGFFISRDTYKLF